MILGFVYFPSETKRINIMKMNNLFNKTGSLLLAGALAFTFSSCDTDTRSNQSTVREAENQYETETDQGADINDPSITYDQGEYQTTTEGDNYDYDQTYSYEQRDLVIDRVRNDLQSAEESLQQLEQQLSTQTQGTGEEVQADLEEIREDLQETREKLNEKLEKLETSTEETWDEVRNETNESLREFDNERENLRNRFGPGESGANNTKDMDSPGNVGTATDGGTETRGTSSSPANGTVED